MLRVNIKTYEEPYETQQKIMWFQDIYIIFYQKEVTNLAATLVLLA